MTGDQPDLFRRPAAVLQVLDRRTVTHSRELARRLGVTQRTIFRYVKELRKQGVPLLGEAGVGFYLR